jgi:hypothetical protein
MKGQLQQISRNRALAFALALVLAFSLAPLIGAQADGTGGAAYAAERTVSADPQGAWTDYGNYDISWFDVGNYPAKSYTITNAAQLAGFAALVNGTAQESQGGSQLGPYSFYTATTRSAIILSAASSGAFNLTAHYWTPIGGNGPSVQGVPNAPAFSGTFDGNTTVDLNFNVTSGTEITGMVIDPDILSAGNEGFGLFGYVDGGALGNIVVSGTIESSGGATDVAKASAIGGIVGYIYGNVTNCHSKVEINVPATTSNNISETGGIAGVIENPATSSAITGSSVYITYSSNEGNITGGSRAGGIAGAVYAIADGGAMLSASYNTGDITTLIADSRAYVGGIEGYSRGYIYQTANAGNISSKNGHYIAGLAGIIQGAAPQGNAQHSFNAGIVSTEPGVGYSQALIASVDDSTSMPLDQLFGALAKALLARLPAPHGAFRQMSCHCLTHR